MVIRLDGTLVSRPYIEMTIAIAKEFGADMTFEHDRIIVRHSELLRPIHYCVESDWSAASYAYSIVSLAPQASELFLRTPSAFLEL